MSRNVERTRLSVKVRDNVGRKLKSIIAPKIARAMSDAGDNIKFMPLEYSDYLFSRFIRRYNDINGDGKMSVIQSYNSKDKFLVDVIRLQPPAGVDIVYVFFQDSDKVGCMKITWRKLVQHVLIILDIDGDSISICDNDLELGMILDKEELSSGAVWEIVGWGVTLPTS